MARILYSGKQTANSVKIHWVRKKAPGAMRENLSRRTIDKRSVYLIETQREAARDRER